MLRQVSHADVIEAWVGQTQAAISFLPPESSLEPAYTTKRCTQAYSFYQNVFENRIFKKFMLQHAGTSFVNKLEGIIKRQKIATRSPLESSLIIQDLTHSSYVVPNRDALIQIARRYGVKYDIPIIVACPEEVYDILEAFKRRERGVCPYLGIVLTDGMFPDSAIPALFYFGENSTTNTKIVECALCDGHGFNKDNVPINEFYDEVIDTFMQLNLDSLFLNKTIWQFDQFSGRNRAIVFLRNALIDLQYRKITLSLQDILKEYTDDNGFNFSNLPPQWIYTEQRNSNLDEEINITRDLYSRTLVDGAPKPMQTIYEFRQKYQHQVTLQCTLNLAKRNFIQIFKCIVPPEGVQIEAHEDSCQIVFQVNEFAFGYLYNKGNRYKEKYLASRMIAFTQAV